ncbi:hypothetical protein ACVWXO_006145 [Bradyrhizobium sp. LM2.7]
MDRTERLGFDKFREASSEDRLRRLSDWLSGIGPEVLGGRGGIATMVADAGFRNAWMDANGSRLTS